LISLAAIAKATRRQGWKEKLPERQRRAFDTILFGHDIYGEYCLKYA
jgi:hypothetical protein